MTKRKATLKEAKRFIKKQIIEDNFYFHQDHIKMILNEVYPFSWQKYCDKKKIKTELKEAKG